MTAICEGDFVDANDSKKTELDNAVVHPVGQLFGANYGPRPVPEEYAKGTYLPVVIEQDFEAIMKGDEK
jgi:hypothetical protein